MVGTSSPDPCSAPSTERAAAWANRQSPAERASLVDAYTPLVRRLAARIYSRRVGGELEYADLVQLGMVGLLEAIDRYTPVNLSSITCEVLAVSAELDLLSPPGLVAALHAPVPRVQYQTIPNAAHSIHWEKPDEVASAIVEFLGEPDLVVAVRSPSPLRGGDRGGG